MLPVLAEVERALTWGCCAAWRLSISTIRQLTTAGPCRFSTISLHCRMEVPPPVSQSQGACCSHAAAPADSVPKLRRNASAVA
jgi:hypothetical protein